MKTSFLQTGISTAALSLSAVAAFAADGRPNILYIMSDDHSFQTIGVYASVLKDYVKTPQYRPYSQRRRQDGELLCHQFHQHSQPGGYPDGAIQSS